MEQPITLIVRDMITMAVVATETFDCYHEMQAAQAEYNAAGFTTEPRL